MAIVITSIGKKGPVLTCVTSDGRAYKVDFSEGKVYGITGKPIHSMNTIISKIPLSAQKGILYQALILLDNTLNPSLAFYSTLESLLSYPDLLKGYIARSFVDYLIARHEGKLPKGYVAWCRKNNYVFHTDTIEQFTLEQKLTTWPRNLRDTAKKISDGMNIDLIRISRHDAELCTSLIRIINNSIKRYELAGLNDALYHICRVLENMPNLRKYLDDTKCAKVACQILDDIQHKERNRCILQNEAKIAALNGAIVRDDIMIKVPSTLDDFVDEGNQQHNCVGHYYHDSIAAGHYLIYFLRHADKPDESYITCRFDTREQRTVEHRLAFNSWFRDEELMNKIDAMIREVLQ